MDFLEKLNPPQRDAVTTTEGPLLILAGAGSGKTRVITYRIVYLVQQGVRPESILAVTFTNKAAQEMKERVSSLLTKANEGEDGPRASGSPLLSTFHSLCVRILRRDIEKGFSEYSRDFTIYDSDDQMRVVKNVMKDLQIDDKLLPPRTVQAAISSAKNRGESSESYVQKINHAGDAKKDGIAKVYVEYERRLRKNNALDFDDLLIKTVELLRRSDQTRDYYNRRFRYILIDEYQDTNGPQFNLVRLLTQQSQNLCVVGDDDQSVYAWRGADISNILNFEKHYPNAKVIRLEQNYRSSQKILKAASAVIKNNQGRKGKELWTENDQGSNIRYYQAYSGDGEAQFVVEKIREHLREDSKTKFAVLYRANSQSRLFEEACRRENLRYQIVGGFSFYERAEVKDTIAYLKLALNPNDSIALSRVLNTPPRGIGKGTVDAIESLAKEKGLSLWEAISLALREQTMPQRNLNGLKTFSEIINTLGEKALSLPLSDVVKATLRDSSYLQMLETDNSPESESRLMNLEELVNAAVESQEKGDTLRDFLDHAALISDTDQYTDGVQVTLMTMHSAKGLEFPVVFIAGLEDGLFPHSRSIDDEIQLEEERRLCYVAITRAEKQLYLTHAMKRRVYGDEIVAQPSKFLNEFPKELIEDLSTVPSWLKHKAQAEDLSSGYEQSYDSGPKIKKTSNYSGKRYNSVDSVMDFFKQRNIKPGTGSQPPKPSVVKSGTASKTAPSFNPGARVRHAKYGVGEILKREGAGDQTKLIINFPGFGLKKLIEKFAELEPVTGIRY